MRNYRKSTMVILLFLSLSFFYCPSAQSCTAENTQSELEKILKSCAEYCEKLSKSVFNVVCFEDIEERLYYNAGYATDPEMRYRTNRYIYDYQLIWEGNEIK